MANDGAASIYGLAMRVARLGPTGLVQAGATNMYVSNAFTEITFEPEYAEGDEAEVKNAAGLVCVSYKAPDTLKRLNVSITLCAPDPELTEILSGGTILATGGSTVGYQYPAIGEHANPNGVSIEVWSRAIVDGSPGTPPYIRWVFPWFKDPKFGERAFNTDPMEIPIEGIAIQNANWADGPTNDWTLASNRVLQYAREATIPTVTVGYQATPSQAGGGSVQAP